MLKGVGPLEIVIIAEVEDGHVVPCDLDEGPGVRISVRELLIGLQGIAKGHFGPRKSSYPIEDTREASSRI